MGTPPGWYPDPNRPGSQRWWDGNAWTEHTGGQPPAASPATQPLARSDAKTWAVAAHLSALVAAFIALAFLGPMIVYLLKKDDDPFIRHHAAEALNFNLSALIYALVGGVVLVIGIVLVVGIVLIPFAIAAAVAWLVLIVIAAIKAGNGEAYRYPLTIRFVN